VKNRNSSKEALVKRRINPENEGRRERREELTEFLDSVGVSEVTGVQDLFKEPVSSVPENGLEGELEE